MENSKGGLNLKLVTEQSFPKDDIRETILNYGDNFVYIEEIVQDSVRKSNVASNISQSTLQASSEALSNSISAKNMAQGVAQQLNNLVLNSGGSTGETILARTDLTTGENFSSLRERLDTQHDKLDKKITSHSNNDNSNKHIEVVTSIPTDLNNTGILFKIEDAEQVAPNILSIADVNNKVKLLSENKADISYVNQMVQTNNTTFKESYATLADLENAYPFGSMYNHVVLNNGMIYTWINNAWVNTQIQANGTGVANGSISREKLDDKTSKGISEVIDNASSQGFSYAVADKKGRLSELILNTQGQIPNNVLNAWKTRMELTNVLKSDSNIPLETLNSWKSLMGLNDALTPTTPISEQTLELWKNSMKILSKEENVDADLNDLSWGVVDSQYRLSELVLNTEGQVPNNVLNAWKTRMELDDVLTPTSPISEATIQSWKTRMKVLSDEEEVNAVMNDLSWGVVDSQYRLSELILNTQGQVPNRVLNAWKTRMGLDEITQQNGSNSGEIVAWGDSLTANGWDTTSYIAEIGRLSGRKVHNMGVGGETSNTIAARQGGLVMLVNNITIPASSSQRIEIARYSTDNFLEDNTGGYVIPMRQGSAGINPCYINGIKGTISVSQSSITSTDYVLYFQRETSGSQVVINRPTPIITDGALNRRNDIMVIFIGTNGGYEDNEELIMQIKQMIEFNTATRKEYIVLGLTSGDATYRAELEKDMLFAFGRRFINLREYLSTYGLADLGITPTQQDLTYMSNGRVPPSLLTDTVHHTAECRGLIGRIVYKRMVELNIL